MSLEILQHLKLLFERNLLNFVKTDNKTIDEMLDSRDNLEFETDWLRIFQQLEQKSFSADELTAI